MSGRSNWESRRRTKALRHLMAEYVQHSACSCQIPLIKQLVRMFKSSCSSKHSGNQLLQDYWLLAGRQRRNQSYPVSMMMHWNTWICVDYAVQPYWHIWTAILIRRRAVTHPLWTLRGPPADHWALVSGLPTYVAENGFVSLVFVVPFLKEIQTLQL